MTGIECKSANRVTPMEYFNSGIAVVIPCYKVKKHILAVLAAISSDVRRIYVVDDKCPENTGQHVLDNVADPRVVVLFNETNQGVGGAVIRGYKEALQEDDIRVVVKIDGDGQMDPALLRNFAAPILDGEADYTKGNRFYFLDKISTMPGARIFGNAGLSFMTKFSSGYWQLFDPTNGYTAIHAAVLKHLPLDKIDRRYFFETDMLFRLNSLRAAVIDIPMDAKYENESSNIKIGHVFWEFLFKHLKNTLKRIFYNYYLRDLSIASVELPLGIIFFFFGVIFGISRWLAAMEAGSAATAGTAIIASTFIIVGMQLILNFLAHDIAMVPKRPVHPRFGPYDISR